MKLKILIPLLAVCAAPLRAEPPQPGGSRPAFPPTPGRPGEQMKERFRDKMMDNLPPEIRARFEAAREKAMQDPAIQELKKKADTANDELRKAMRDAITKADPGLAEIIKERMKDRGKDRGKGGRPGEPPGFANLSEGDRQKLMAAREKAKDDPSVQAAETLKKDAKTPGERHAAMEQFHKAMKAALLKADPTLGPILDQLKPPQGPPPPPGENPSMDDKPGQ